MTPSKIHRMVCQKLANRRMKPHLKVDGAIGPISKARFRDLLNVVGMTGTRLCAGMIQQHTQTWDQPLKLDFWWGPNTDFAAEVIHAALNGCEIDLGRPDESDDPPASPACWKPTDAQMVDFYGKPGTNQVTIDLPFPLRLDWNLAQVVTRMTCHEKVAKPTLAALKDVRLRWDRAERARLGLDRWGGCLNVRKKRGGSTWSAHAFGAAHDWFPTRNRLRWKAPRALFSQPVYEDWRAIWAEHGFMSLGQCFDFDWMHWQLNPH